jgi:hypothetical protein
VDEHGGQGGGSSGGGYSGGSNSGSNNNGTGKSASSPAATPVYYSTPVQSSDDRGVDKAPDDHGRS